MQSYIRSTIVRLIVAAALAVSAGGAWAQGVTGAAVTGVVKDPTGGPAEGVQVVLKNTSTGHTFNATTGADGKFTFDNVPAGGPYTLTATLTAYEGVAPIIREKIDLALGQRLNLDLESRITAETIQIEAFADRLDDKARTGMAARVNETSIARLPLAGRNFTDLASTAPQVSGTSVAGQNNRYNNIQIDGGANNDLFGLAGSGTPGGQSNAKPISVEAIREFNVQIAPFDVRQGAFTGGLINAITKSGTNEFHGGLFGYYQNKKLAGRQNDPNFLSFNTWQYGAFVGGPIVKDKAHFFVALDLQSRAQSFGNQFQIGGKDNAADLARAGFTVAEAERFQAILAKYGITNAGNALAPDLSNPDRNLFVKVTTSIIDNSNLELSYNLVSANNDILGRSPTSPSIPGRLRDGYQLSNSGYGITNSTNTLRAKLTTNWAGGKFSNEFLGSASFIRDSRETPTNAPLILVKAGRLGANDAWLAAGAERFSQTNSLDQDIFQLQDNLTYAIDKHRITVGTSNEFLGIRNAFLQASTGVWAFNSLDDFDAGKVAAFERRFGVSKLQDPGTAKFNVQQLGFYVQDEWTPLRNVTVTPGLRIDVPLLSKANQNTQLLNVAAPLGPIDTSKVPSGNILWSPRLGVNWDVEGNSNTIVRGGIGVFSGRPPYVWVSNAYAINGLSQVQLTCNATTTPAGAVPAFTPDPTKQPSDCTGGSGTPTPPTNVGEVDYFDPDTRYPQNARVALGVDRRLPWGIVGTLDLLYTQDINGWYTTDENLTPSGLNGEGRETYGTFGTSATSFSASPLRIDRTNLTQAVKVFNKNGGRAWTNTVSLTKQFGAQYNIALGYTFSRSYDRISLTSSQALSNFQFAPLDGTIASRNIRPSAFDRPHRLTATATMDVGYGLAVGLNYTGQSGTPYTWTVNGDVNADGINGNDLVFVPKDSGQISLQNPAQYDALNAFIDSRDCLKDAKGRFIRRGECRNPWQNFINGRLSWTSPEIRGQRFEAQLDIFNIVNLLGDVFRQYNWNLFKEAAAFENHSSAFLRAVGYDTANKRPIYAFTQPTSVTQIVYTPTLSRWRMQLGARYLF